MRVAIPRSNTSRRERTYACCGSVVDEGALWPGPEYPPVPLVVEFAGSDGTGRGHNRSPDTHVLWRYDRALGSFTEIARVKSQGGEWVAHLLPMVERELRAIVVVNGIEAARKACARVLELLDRELAHVPEESRIRVVTLVYDGVAARLVA